MITRIVCSCMMFFLIIAFFLSIVGVTHVATGDEYYAFLKSVDNVYSSWKVSIPDIPSINRWDEVFSSGGDNIFDAFRGFVNAIIGIINVVIKVVNILITVLNVVIGLVQIMLSTIYCIKDFVERLRDLNSVRVII